VPQQVVAWYSSSYKQSDECWPSPLTPIHFLPAAYRCCSKQDCPDAAGLCSPGWPRHHASGVRHWPGLLTPNGGLPSTTVMWWTVLLESCMPATVCTSRSSGILLDLLCNATLQATLKVLFMGLAASLLCGCAA
jgi:hypothetical protein